MCCFDDELCSVGATTYFDDEDESLTLSARKRRVNTKSKDYLEYCPKREDGLYKRLMQEVEDIEVSLLLLLIISY